MAQISMTYGTLPEWDVFEAQFDAQLIGCYKVQNCERVGNAEFTATELYREVQQAINDWENQDEPAGDAAGDWASCVLQTLGIEWV